MDRKWLKPAGVRVTKRNFIGGFVAVVAGLFGGRQARSQVQGQSDLDELNAKVRAAFPYEVTTVKGKDALAEWRRLRAAGDKWPIIVGDDEALDRIVEQYSIDDPNVYESYADGPLASLRPRGVEEILAAADSIELPSKLESLFAEEYGGDASEADVGEWPANGAPPGPGLTVAADILTGKAFDRVHIVLVPTNDFAEVPAYLRWGAWNACPAPEVHVAVLRRWREAWGVELVGMSGDVINLTARNRPETRKEALALAREQYLYCPDIVEQGTETLAPLAATLMEDDWWFFWWD